LYSSLDRQWLWKKGTSVIDTVGKPAPAFSPTYFRRIYNQLGPNCCTSKMLGS
jgi:hypothetical protein